jgi:hypothetical protein
VGILAERLARLEAGVLMAPHRADAIEADACRRLGLDPADGRLAGLALRGRTVAGGRRSVEVVEIDRPDTSGRPLMYGMKTCHGAEPDSARWAAECGAGPAVLDVSDGCITEEYFPEATNLRQRRVGPDDYEPLGTACGRLLVALVRRQAGDLLVHKDEQPEHLFVLGQGADLAVRLIDWGRADRWPLERFEEWLAAQYYWLYTYLSLGEPAVWRALAAHVAETMPDPPGRKRLADGYLAFVEAQTAGLDDPMRSGFATGFLAFSVRCGPLPMDLGWFNAFVQEAGDARGKALARAFEDAKP